MPRVTLNSDMCGAECAKIPESSLRTFLCQTSGLRSLTLSGVPAARTEVLLEVSVLPSFFYTSFEWYVWPFQAGAREGAVKACAIAWQWQFV